MVTYHSSGVIRKLVRYIEKYYPKALLIIRPKDTLGNRERGYKSGQPDIIVLEPKIGHAGVAIWAVSEMSRCKTRFLRRLRGRAYETIVSDDYDDIRLSFTMYMALCPSPKVDHRQIRVIKSRNKPFTRHFSEYLPLTSCGVDTVMLVIRYIRENYPSVAVIPGLGVDGQPAIIVTEPGMIHNGLAIWVREVHSSYCFEYMSDNQLAFLKRMAAMSYITEVSDDYQDIVLYNTISWVFTSPSTSLITL